MSQGWWALGCVGCVWIDGVDGERLDRDGDGYPGAFDCNDDRADVSTLFGTGQDLACDSTVDASVQGLSDDGTLLGIVPCEDPLVPDRLVGMAGTQRVHRFLAEEAGAVTFELDASDFGFGGGAGSSNVAFIVNDGPQCATDRCVVGLPAFESSPPVDWAPRATVSVGAGEAWYVVVNGPPQASYSLDVQCD